MSLRIWFQTLGCKANQYDTEMLRTALIGLGCETAQTPAEADLIVVNTCAVTAEAERKSRQALRRGSWLAPHARVVTVGCLVAAAKVMNKDLPPTHLARDDGARHEGMAALLAELGFSNTPVPAGIAGFDHHTRSFLKVQDGCDNHCTYCIIPTLRGPSRSRPLTEILAEAKTMIGRGIPEIVLTGVCLGDWREGRAHLDRLVTSLAGLPGNFRLRLSSIEPEHTDRALLAAMAAAGPERVCPHLHIPLQNGSDQVLKLMGRRYGAADYLELVALARQLLDRPVITTDVIVGFPGERESDFTTTMEVVEKAFPLRTHVFPYSSRKSTPAEKLPAKVPPEIIRQRAAQLRKKADELAHSAARSSIGQVELVIPEEGNEGWSGRYQRVRIISGETKPGALVATEIVDTDGPLLLGRVTSSP